MGYETAANWEFADGQFRIFRVWDTVAPEPLGTEPPQAKALQAFPNPCHDILWVSHEPGTALELYSADGRLVKTLNADQPNSIDMRGLQRGLYYLRIGGPNAAGLKILKQ
jgi:hypothetical protein